MDKDKLEKLNEYYKSNKNKCMALKSWIAIKDKDFKLVEALECIYDAAKGKVTVMTDIIDHLCNYRKTYSRAQVYADNFNLQKHIDIVRHEGKLVLINYNKDEELTKKGQRGERNPNIFRKSDGHTKKTYQQKEEIFKNIGAVIRRLLPYASKELLERIIKAVSDYANDKKISYTKVLKGLEERKLFFDTKTNTLKPSTNENRTIVITEDIFRELQDCDELCMSEYKFNSNIKHFLSNLLADPSNAQPSPILLKYGLKRSKLIPLLLNNGMLCKSEKISDKDENGDFKTATMKIRFKVPKKDFKHKLKKLYIKIFERNVPSDSSYGVNDYIMEDGEGAMGGCGATGADASGAFEQPLFGVQRRKMPTNISETDTFNAGDYGYDALAFGDKESLSRKNGKFGSVSVNNQ